MAGPRGEALAVWPWEPLSTLSACHWSPPKAAQKVNVTVTENSRAVTQTETPSQPNFEFLGFGGMVQCSGDPQPIPGPPGWQFHVQPRSTQRHQATPTRCWYSADLPGMYCDPYTTALAPGEGMEVGGAWGWLRAPKQLSCGSGGPGPTSNLSHLGQRFNARA